MHGMRRRTRGPDARAVDVRRAFRSLVLGLLWASIWPGYLVLVAQAARLGPWPRNLGILASTVLHGLALGVFVPGVLAWLTRRDGWAERFLGVPAPVGRQLCRAGRFLAAAAVVCLVPTYLLSSGEIAPEGRPITAVAFCRFFTLTFEVAVWATLVRMLQRNSPFMCWCDLEPAGAVEGEIAADSAEGIAALAHSSSPAGFDRGIEFRPLAGRAQPTSEGPCRNPPGAGGWCHRARCSRLSLHGPATGQRRGREPGRVRGLLGLQPRRLSDHRSACAAVGDPRTIVAASPHDGDSAGPVANPRRRTGQSFE